MKPKEWRKKVLKITLEDLAVKIGSHASYLSLIETEKVRASGRLMALYFQFSRGKVTPADFAKGVPCRKKTSRR